MTTNELGEVSQRLKDAINIAPMERMELSNEIADSTVLLCSGEINVVTGTGKGLVVDGGMSSPHVPGMKGQSLQSGPCPACYADIRYLNS